MGQEDKAVQGKREAMNIKIAAQKRVTDVDLGLIELWNAHRSTPYAPPEELGKELKSRIGIDDDTISDELAIPLSEDGMVEVDVSDWQNEVWGDGFVISIKDLPRGTFAIRIYA